MEWKRITADLPTDRPILGAWLKTRPAPPEYRMGICEWIDGAWISERGAEATLYLTTIPAPAVVIPAEPDTHVEPFEPDPTPTGLEPEQFVGGATDWDGDPTGPPNV